jgi:ferritin-like metal-binding protein YciE
MSPTKSLYDVLSQEIKDLYSAETQLLRSVPHLIKAVTDRPFKAALTAHLTQTKQHIARLKEVADLLGISPAGKVCQAMEGLIAEGEERIAADSPGPARDASLICLTQKIEHYEIAGYGCVRTFAQVLGLHKAAELLQTTLDEECAEDRELTGLADIVNSRAEFPHGMMTVIS